MEFPELKGHARRDYWLAIIREVLYAHRFLNKFQITGVERDEALLKATLGILRVQALKEMSIASPSCEDSLLMFNLCDQLPGGDLVLEALANMSSSRDLDRTTHSNAGGRMYSTSAISMASSLGFVFGTSSNVNEAGLCVGEIIVGEISPLERAVTESRSNHKKVAFAKATVDGVKVDGFDTNLAVMKVLLIFLYQLFVHSPFNWIFVFNCYTYGRINADLSRWCVPIFSLSLICMHLCIPLGHEPFLGLAT